MTPDPSTAWAVAVMVCAFLAFLAFVLWLGRDSLF